MFLERDDRARARVPSHVSGVQSVDDRARARDEGTPRGLTPISRPTANGSTRPFARGVLREVPLRKNKNTNEKDEKEYGRLPQIIIIAYTE